MRILKIAVAASTTVALIGGSAVVAPAAGAYDTYPVIVSVDARPETVGLYMTSTSTVIVDVQVTDDVAVASVSVSVFAEACCEELESESGGQASLVSGTAQNGTWRAMVPLDTRNHVGTWTTRVIATDSADNADVAGLDDGPPFDNFYVKRNTMINRFNVVEPVTRGSHIQMSGRLIRLDPHQGYVGFRNKTIHVLFRPAGWTTWRDKGSVITNSRGSFANSHTFRAWRDGAWRARFDGTHIYLEETSPGDYVDVR